MRKCNSAWCDFQFCVFMRFYQRTEVNNNSGDVDDHDRLRRNKTVFCLMNIMNRSHFHISFSFSFQKKCNQALVIRQKNYQTTNYSKTVTKSKYKREN